MASSDLLPRLGRVTPLGGGEAFTTEKVIAAQYPSLNIVLSASHPTDVFVEFSGDGFVFPGVEILFSFSGTTPETKSIVVSSKWVRIRYENGIIQQTYLRAFVYGAISATSVN